MRSSLSFFKRIFITVLIWLDKKYRAVRRSVAIISALSATASFIPKKYYEQIPIVTSILIVVIIVLLFEYLKLLYASEISAELEKRRITELAKRLPKDPYRK